ncbi:MAG: Tsp45I type II restriction enzyme [archaeon ADurb.Bin336]|nr:MAG: Tsp45I type II restriction enzyme [archaeon ADurb.Bin336]
MANRSSYLDKLQYVYPFQKNEIRPLSKTNIKLIEKEYRKGNGPKLLETLLTLEKFPIDNKYIGSLKISQKLRENNPKIIKQISDILLELELDTLLTYCQMPKKDSRQMGNVFKNWLKSKYNFVKKSEFESSSDPLVFLQGSDSKLKDYINSKFDANLTEPTYKGLDFVFKKNNIYCCGEAKFISASGGGQDNQFNIALKVADLNINGIKSLALIDGVPWLLEKYKTKMQQNTGKNIMSALLLDKFISEL